MYCRDRFALGNKKPVLTAVHPAYACEATTAKERGRSLVAELEPWKRGPVGVPTIHKVQRHRRGELLRGRRESLGTRLRCMYLGEYSIYASRSSR